MWFLSARQARRSPPIRSGRNTFRPKLEALEERCLLSLGAGSLDPTFGSGGTAIGPSALNGPAAVVVQPDGKIVVGGEIYNGSTNQWALERFNPNGSVDTTFGTSGTGIVSTVLGNLGDSYINALAIDAYGDIVAVGNAWTSVGKNPDAEFAVARYTTDGSLDTAFGSGKGFVLTNVNPYSKQDAGLERATDVAIQGDGKIVVGGAISSGSLQVYGNFTLVCYNADGTLDTSFGNQSPKDGINITSSFGGNGDYATALALQSDGNILLAGESTDHVKTGRSYTNYNSMAVARYSAAGQLDSSFGTGGTVTLGPQSSEAYSVLVQSNGAIVLGGYYSTTNAGGLILARLKSNGQLDTTFASSGFATNSMMTINGGPAVHVFAQGANGDLLAAGLTPDGSSFAVAAFLPGGAPDTTFGTGGITTDAISGGVYVAGMAVQHDGKIVVAGVPSSSSSYALARFLPSNTQIGWPTAAPNPVSAGTNVTLTVSNIYDNVYPTTTITQVSFYQDTNGNGTLDSTDLLLGTGTLNTSSSVWTFTFSTTGLATGTYTLFAQAGDAGGTLYAPLSIQVTVQ